MLKCYDLADGRIRSCPEGQPGMIQIYSGPTDEEKDYLITECGIDAHTLASALDEDEISRLEYESNHIAVIMKHPKEVKLNRRMAFRVSSLGAFFFADRVIVVQKDNNPLFEHGKMPLRGNSVAGVLLRLLHHATQHFLQHLRIIRSISEEIEKKIEYAITNKSLVNIFSLQKSLTYYESAIGANLLLLGKLRVDAKKLGFCDEELEFLEDITIENKQSNYLASIYTSILSRMNDSRMSVANNNLAGIMKFLAIINIVFLPLTVITGIGGMSEFSMMTHGIWWPHAYGGLIVFLVIVGFVTYLVVRGIGSSRNNQRR